MALALPAVETKNSADDPESALHSSVALIKKKLAVVFINNCDHPSEWRAMADRLENQGTKNGRLLGNKTLRNQAVTNRGMVSGEG